MNYKHRILDGLDELQSLMILLAYTDNNTPIKGKVKLQKIMYLLTNRIDSIREQSDYKPYRYGPYSEIIDEEAKYLQSIGVFHVDKNVISLTDQGLEIAKVLQKKEKKQVLDYINDFKQFLNDLTSDELLCYVYSAYPEMAVNSTELERLSFKMGNTLLNLVKKQKISLERASELLNKDIEQLVHKSKEKGIRVLS